MGWSSGEEIFQQVWETVAPQIKKKHRLAICEELVGIFEAHDADTLFDNVEWCPELLQIKEKRYPNLCE